MDGKRWQSETDIELKSGDEPLHVDGEPVSGSLLGYWRWIGSDLLSNAMRGLFAEYIVGMALGGCHKPRAEWDPWDIETPKGLKVEVKSSAYLQSWRQDRPGTIKFGIAPAHNDWDGPVSEQNPRKRHADVYVFCVLAHRDKATVDPTNLAQWEFYVVPTRVLDECLGAQKRITLGSLKRLVAEPVAYKALASAVRSVISPSAPLR